MTPFIEDIKTVLLYDPIHFLSKDGKNDIRNILSRENHSKYSHYFDDPEQKFIEFMDKVEIAKTFDELCNGVDNALILTPPNTHLKLSHELASHNKKCLVEKPITNSLQQILNLTDCEISLMHKYVFYAESFIHTPFFKLLKGRISQLGNLKKIYASFPHGGQTGDSHSNWRLNKHIAGGGVGMDWMIHMTGLSLYLTQGENITSIDKVDKKHVPTDCGDIDSYIKLTGSIKGQANSLVEAEIEGSWQGRSILEDNQIIFVEGEYGTIDVRHFRDGERRKIYELIENKNGITIKNSYQEEFPHDSFYYTLTNFLNENAELMPYMNFQFGLDQFRLINTIQGYE